MGPGYVRSMLVFLDRPVLPSGSFVAKFQDAVDDEGCPFKHVVLYSTRDSECSVHEAFGPAVTAVVSCWGKNLPIDNAVVDAWMIDRWAQDIVVTTGQKRKSARLRYCLDFATRGWEPESVLELCECEWRGDPYDKPTKAWESPAADKVGAPTLVSVKCSWCKTENRLDKPPHVPSPTYVAGAWYCDVGPTPVGTADGPDVQRAPDVTAGDVDIESLPDETAGSADTPVKRPPGRKGRGRKGRGRKGGRNPAPSGDGAAPAHRRL
ncbi:hypothetical protein FRC09_020482 [Ceratobasidium sp. 395]|nr:hypothetical protein FRC09_020482 [Ceratobasidium sp. 395]